MSFTLTGNGPVDRINVKGPLTFNKTTFDLSWTDKPADTYFIQEYLPQNESVEHFNQMLTIHLFDQPIEVQQAVNQKVKELDTRKTTDKVCNYQVTRSPDKKEFIVDFLLGESKDNSMTIVEFNIYRYKQVTLGKDRKGILVYAYSKRAYGNDINTFFKTLGNDRTALLNVMTGADMPDVKIKE